MEFKYIVLIICAIIALLLMVIETKRKNKANVLWRILASFCMLMSFAFLIVTITYQTVIKQPKAELNLLTAGTELQTIATIKGEKYVLDSTLFSERKHLKIKPIDDLSYYLQENKEVKKINIYGYGLEEVQLAQLQDYQLSFNPAPIPAGINSVSWQKKVKETENLIVQGVFNNTSNQDIQLKLIGLGANLDSTFVKANSKINFSLINQPKLSGKAIYQIIAIKRKDTVFTEKVAFEVLPKQKLQVLILASFPDFEYKFLKNWLYQKQYQVVFRSQISKDKYTSEFLNTKAIAVSLINQKLLNQMDVLLIDEDEMSAISAGERAAINAAVSNGMGLIIRLTNPKPNVNIPSYGRYVIPSTAAPGIQISAVNENIKFGDLPFPQTIFLEATQNEQALFKSIAGKAVVKMQLSGRGKVLISSLASTYQWELAGKNGDYALFWSSLFLQAAKKEVNNQSLEYDPQFLTIGSRAHLIINLKDDSVPKIAFNDIILNPKQNMELPFRWNAVFWPTLIGWNSVKINNISESIFIYHQTDWEALRNTDKLILNTSYSSHQIINERPINPTLVKVDQEVSKWWFYLLFLCAAAYLWFEQRFLIN